MRRRDGEAGLFTPAGSEAYDVEWRRFSEQYERWEWTDRARPFVDHAGFAAIERDLAAKGAGYRPRDVYWVAADRGVLELLKRADWGAAQIAYIDMARLAYDEENEDQESERVLTLKRAANRAMLQSYMALGTNRVEILVCACRVCSVGPKKHLNLVAELKEPRLPHANCAEGWCACDYVPEPD